jgi:hypothetical protein
MYWQSGVIVSILFVIVFRYNCIGNPSLIWALLWYYRIKYHISHGIHFIIPQFAENLYFPV